MSTADLINEILVGGLLGAIGQGIRVAVGLGKLNTSNVNKAIDGDDKEEFSPARLILSIFIGMIAGAIAALLKGPVSDSGAKEYYFPIIAAGYSGADFIEGVFNTAISKLNPPTKQNNDNKGAAGDTKSPAGE